MISVGVSAPAITGTPRRACGAYHSGRERRRDEERRAGVDRLIRHIRCRHGARAHHGVSAKTLRG
jgi:hypothetical protein